MLFLLKRHEIDLAVAEAKALSYGWRWWEHKEQAVDGVLYLDTRKVPAPALTRKIIKVVATCAPGNVRTTLSSLRWPKKSYKVVLTKQTTSQESERELANIIWRSMRSPKVDLLHPQMIIEIIITGKLAYIGVRAWENGEDYEARKAHRRPVLHPSSMHPAMARALVHLTCAKTIHDPFCGSGGILIEAGLAHKKSSGADISPDMIIAARKNCAAYHLHPDLRVADATMWAPRVQAVIADLPYGKNTRPVALKPLYDAFLLQQSAKRAVVGLPCELPVPEGWRVRAHFTSYVHKSMTKHLYVLERNRR